VIVVALPLELAGEGYLMLLRKTVENGKNNPANTKALIASIIDVVVRNGAERSANGVMQLSGILWITDERDT
jgi:hypothetical protein